MVLLEKRKASGPRLLVRGWMDRPGRERPAAEAVGSGSRQDRPTNASTHHLAGIHSEAMVSQSDQRDIGSWPAFLDYVMSADIKFVRRDYLMKLAQQRRSGQDGKRLRRKATPFFSQTTQQSSSDSLQFLTCWSHVSTQTHMDINSDRLRI
eukprot:s3543_g3.t1